MYVLQDGDKFYWRGEGSSNHHLADGFENAHLFINKTRSRTSE
jgi:hypothetical protein